jgi:hypothetical protein
MKFEGREPSLKGFIYDSTGERSPDQYIKTMKEVINYIRRTYTKCTVEFTQAVRDLELMVPTPPADLDPTNTIAFEMWKLEIKEFRVKEQEYPNFQAGLYNLVLGQCTEALQDKLKSCTHFPNAYQDGIAVLMIIKMLTYTFEEHRKLADAIKEMFYSLHQGRHTSLQWYHELFLGQVEVLKEVGVMIPDESLAELIAAANGGRAGAPKETDWTAARKQALAIQFIPGANDSHKAYLTNIWNSFLGGSDYYPSTLHVAYIILHHREPEGGMTHIVDVDRVVFINVGGERGEPRNLDHIICFDCGEPGHYANNCPNRNQG